MDVGERAAESRCGRAVRLGHWRHAPMRFPCGCAVDEDGTRLESCPKPGSLFCDKPRAEREMTDAPLWFVNYEAVGRTIGKLLDEKQKNYGDSFHRCPDVLKLLYPNGI